MRHGDVDKRNQKHGVLTAITDSYTANCIFIGLPLQFATGQVSQLGERSGKYILQTSEQAYSPSVALYLLRLLHHCCG